MADALRFGLRRGAAGTGLLNALRVHNGKGALPPLRTRVRANNAYVRAVPRYVTASLRAKL